MTQPNYPLRFLKTVHRHMRNGTRVETCREVTRTFLEILAYQQDTDFNFNFSECGLDLVPNDQILVSSLDGRRVMTQAPYFIAKGCYLK